MGNTLGRIGDRGRETEHTEHRMRKCQNKIGSTRNHRLGLTGLTLGPGGGQTWEPDRLRRCRGRMSEGHRAMTDCGEHMDAHD